MALPYFISIRWGIGALLELFLLLLALRRKLFDRLPLFLIYVGLVLVSEVVAWSVYTCYGLDSRVSFLTHWAVKATLLLVRALVVYEICRLLLSPYRGVWKLCRPVLAAVAVFLSVLAGVTALENAHPLSATILTADRSLELVVLAILILGLGFCRYYRIPLEGYVVWIGFGLGLYSAAQIVNNTSLEGWPFAAFPVWNSIRIASFNLATLLCIVGLWKPLPVPQPAPSLWEVGHYQALAPPVSRRLRELNARLWGMWK